MAEQKVAEFDSKAFLEAIGEGKEIPPVVLKDGKEVRVKKATAAQIFMILEIVKSLATYMKLQNFQENTLLEALKLFDRPIEFLGAVSGNMDNLLELSASLTNEMSRKEVEALELDDLVRLVWAQWEVNQYFFTKSLMPLIQNLGMKQQSQEQSESSKS